MKAEKNCEKFVGSKECGKPATCKVYPACELCGKEAMLVEVADCDRTVGYHGSVEICAECRETYKNRCGACGDSCTCEEEDDTR